MNTFGTKLIAFLLNLSKVAFLQKCNIQLGDLSSGSATIIFSHFGWIAASYNILIVCLFVNESVVHA